MQHPVGHGFFHTAAISTVDAEERDVFRYVYDCGSLSRDSDFRRLAINTWSASHGSVVPLDLVYISHMDFDHRSGLEQLVAGRKVGTYILPLVDPAERVAAWARHVVNDGFVSEVDRRFVFDPVGALRSLSPGSRIIFIMSGDSEPPSGWRPPIQDPPPLDESDDVTDSTADTRPRWAIGSGALTSMNRLGVEMVRDTDPLVVTFPRTGDRWIFSHYVDPGIVAHRDTFRRTLRTVLGTDEAGLRTILSDPARLGPMLQVSSASKASNPLIQAYESMYRTKRPDLNLTSLCLYSGPHGNAATGVIGQGSRETPCGTWVDSNDAQVGWLGTGDAKLNADLRIDPFLAKYASYAKDVRTFTLPHHGSDHSLREDLLDRMPAPVYVGPGGGRKHPGKQTTYYLGTRGITPYIVGKTEGYEERFCLVHSGSHCCTPWSVRP